MKNLFALCTLIALTSLAGCHTTVALLPEQAEYLECLRLDREPVNGWDSPRCQPNSGRAKQGTFHRRMDEEIKAEVLPVDVPARHAAKMPVADCLWVGSSSAGAAERLAPQWESTMVTPVEDNNRPDGVREWQFAACRMDPPYPRTRLASVADSRNSFCFNQPYLAIDPNETDLFINSVKSTCDTDLSYLEPLTQLVARSLTSDGYDECAAHDGAPQRVSDYADPAGFCSMVDSVDGVTAQFRNSTVARQDAEYAIEGKVDRTLSPRVRTVVDQRTIARPLAVNQQTAVWHTDVVLDAGRGAQRWRENFTEFVRVRRVRVFSVTSKAVDDRDYLSLDDALLMLVDIDDDSGAPTECAAAEGSFDLNACQIDVTPTYRVSNLSQPGTRPLSAPLEWHIDSAQIEDNGRQYFVEFELDSVFRTRNATLLADVSVVDFGDVNAGEYNQHGVTVTNVGNGYFVIDDVRIDPHHGQAAAFSAQRLDDPVELPHPVSVGIDGDTVDFELHEWGVDYPLLAMQQTEQHVHVTQPLVDGIELDVLGVPLRFAGNTAVLQTASPDLSMTLAPAGRSWAASYLAYREWPTPYTLAPGESRRIQVIGRPQQYGEHTGRITVSGYPLHTPGAPQDIHIALQVNGLLGPRADVLPSALRFPRGRAAFDTLNVIVVSHGDRDLGIGKISVETDPSSNHIGDEHSFSIVQAPQAGDHIAPGASQVITINYNPGCFFAVPFNGEHIAQLSIETDDGIRRVPLHGDPARWVATSSDCALGN
ncbi:MAG: hypothetical protein AAFO81_10575 [Pseudomonadota bacterium]